MRLFFNFSLLWYVLLFVLAMLWLILAWARRSFQNKKEVKVQAVIVIIAPMILFVLETFGVNTNLWHYTEGDWPIILWWVYISGSLFGYQLAKLIEEKVD